MRPGASKSGRVFSGAFVAAFFLVWFGSFFAFVYAAGGGDAAYAIVRWIAGLGPE